MVLLGRNCSQGKLKLIYLMMLLQAAMIVKSLPKYMYLYSLAGHTHFHFQGEWVWVLWTAFRASFRNVRGSNLIGPFLTRHMTSCMLVVYIVLLSFLRTQRKVMMAARSRLSDFLRLAIACCSQLLEPSSLPKQLQQTIVEHSGERKTDTASGYTRESISLNVCVENSLCSCLP